MGIFDVTGFGEANGTESEYEAVTEPSKGEEASIAEAVAIEIAKATDKQDSAVPTPTIRVRRPRSALQQEASRRNGKKSHGPTTAAGKAISSRNSFKHGLLSERLTQLNAQNAKDFADLLSVLREDLKPIGILEETLVEKIAHAYFRMAVAAKDFCDAAKYVVNTSDSGPRNLMRYDSMINRQFYQAMYQLEELQRLRRGQDVPEPINAHISRASATASDERSQAINHNYETNPRSSLLSMFGFQAGETAGKDTPGPELWWLVNSKLPNEPKKCFGAKIGFTT
jgi:hypothetical protein